MADAEKVQATAAEFQKTQTDLENAIDLQQQLLSQLTESREVQKELAKLTPDQTVYKRIGPALLPQDHNDAKDNVNKRLEFIEKELSRVEEQIKNVSASRDKLRIEIATLQQKLQAQ